jgi:MinD-like ATPase involved in chromosome partitioning or flagellar assembly
MMEVPFWGHVPFGVEVGQSMDAGVPVVTQHPHSPIAHAFRHLTQRLVNALQIKGPSEISEEQQPSAPECRHPHGHHHHEKP